MKCFHYFKDKFRSKGQRSVPKPKEERKSEGYSGPPFLLKLEEAKAHNLRVFSFSELRKATRNFNRGLQIEEGGFGRVYKGTIKSADGKGEPLVVAIKKLNVDRIQELELFSCSFHAAVSSYLLVQGRHGWLAEIKILRVLEHPNVIKLIGHCAVDGERGIQHLLMYEFMRNKSLADHLFSKTFPPLPWKIRLQITLGAARALAYLHDGSGVRVPF
ncbi:hypothetical protein V6N12_022312 [Hibiscus sabdariffa]|uniref:Protein kinase domain-containing protein n=1 Tax=Hibiscus sabdariffa TaxID=183260 RepID=A0ABR2FUA3_9ROSI